MSSGLIFKSMKERLREWLQWWNFVHLRTKVVVSNASIAVFLSVIDCKFSPFDCLVPTCGFVNFTTADASKCLPYAATLNFSILGKNIRIYRYKFLHFCILNNFFHRRKNRYTMFKNYLSCKGVWEKICFFETLFQDSKLQATYYMELRALVADKITYQTCHIWNVMRV